MNIETKCVQAGWQPHKGEPRELPIYQSTTFRYETSEEMGKLFDLEAEGYLIPGKISRATYYKTNRDMVSVK